MDSCLNAAQVSCHNVMFDRACLLRAAATCTPGGSSRIWSNSLEFCEGSCRAGLRDECQWFDRSCKSLLGGVFMPILPIRIPAPPLTSRMEVTVQWLSVCAFEQRARRSSGKVAVVPRCDTCGCVYMISATSGAPQFGVCQRLLFWCVQQVTRCSVVFCIFLSQM